MAMSTMRVFSLSLPPYSCLACESENISIEMLNYTDFKILCKDCGAWWIDTKVLVGTYKKPVTRRSRSLGRN